ncbi:alpha/beta fold hydrolase, partial [Bacillus cereus group sp. BfR-BA-01355]|uniref:alpha/beta fold hydrolase n=1 Tax=Bacillus cereus group sp. BfR-BA-01355 TaxID=2920318 RepID=UPI002101ECF8
LGGHSLKATRLVNRIEAETGKKVLLKEVLSNSTVENLAEIITNRKVEEYMSITTAKNQEYYPMALELFRKIDDFHITIAGRPPYSRPNSFIEREIVIGNDVFPLAGTLSIPKGKGPFPVVVLIHGSGQRDRDETIAAVKPFRDLAEGLATKGIAVLRYNKRTYEHESKTLSSPLHTIDKETTDDALRAVCFLQNEQKIDRKQIYILGHSQGGMMVPRIIEKEKNHKIAGAIVMAGSARRIQDVALDQIKHAFALGEINFEVYEFYKKQLELLNDPNFSSENPPKEFKLGQVMFWDSFRQIRAAEMAKNQKTPLLILQGERDFQVRTDVEIPIWQEQLKNRNNIDYLLYPKLNHLFTEGEGELSTIEEYTISANVPEYVINDIANWIQFQADLRSKFNETIYIGN